MVGHAFYQFIALGGNRNDDTVARPGLRTTAAAGEAGGLSGAPLRAASGTMPLLPGSSRPSPLRVPSGATARILPCASTSRHDGFRGLGYHMIASDANSIRAGTTSCAREPH